MRGVRAGKSINNFQILARSAPLFVFLWTDLKPSEPQTETAFAISSRNVNRDIFQRRAKENLARIAREFSEKSRCAWARMVKKLVGTSGCCKENKNRLSCVIQSLITCCRCVNTAASGSFDMAYRFEFETKSTFRSPQGVSPREKSCLCREGSSGCDSIHLHSSPRSLCYGSSMQTRFTCKLLFFPILVRLVGANFFTSNITFN